MTESTHSYLFVPASTPDRIPKAIATDAHRVIVDLEDGVGFDVKDAARQGLTQLGIDRGVVVVPSSAVLTAQEGSQVYVVKADKSVEPRPVEVGTSANGKVIIVFYQA